MLINLIIAILVWILLFDLIKNHCDLLVDNKIECGYTGMRKAECEMLSCCWIPFSAEDLRNPPWCAKKSDQACGFRKVNENILQDYCNKTSQANIEIVSEDSDTLRVKITRSKDEFEVPDFIYPAFHRRSQSYETSKLTFKDFNDQNGNYNFKVERTNSSEIIWNTDLKDDLSASSFQIKHMYTQIGSQLPLNHSIYGLGYHAGSLKIPAGSRIALFARDSATFENQNLYGAHSFYLQIQNGKAHGVYLRNAFGMDVIVKNSSIKFKMLGGPIDLFFFAGPTPLDVIQQYIKIIGKPTMFDYRILGFHQSRYGYKNISQIGEVVKRFEAENIPLDTIWLDIDYMDEKKDFTLDPINFNPTQLAQFTKLLLKLNKRIVPILDPGILIDESYDSYKRGIAHDVFIKNPASLGGDKGKYYVGQVWPGNVHYVDFMHKNALKYWADELKIFFKLFKNSDELIGGLWLDMNEPSNFIDGYNFTFQDIPTDYTNFSLNFPRYMINNGGSEVPIYQKTVPMDTETGLGKSYQTHNMYGLFESMITYRALIKINPKKRPFLLTRSTFPGSGQWTSTWLGDNFSTFRQMALSIPGVLQYGLLGIPFSGADICGFLGEASEELCARWMALGSFYPFSRNHNSISSFVDQEPFRWKSVAEVSRKYLQLRYSLFPYYYNLMYQSHTKGWPIWRPVFFYDKSRAALEIHDQFFVGESLLVSPVLQESCESMIVRIPIGEWYELDTLNLIKTTSKAIRILYKVPLNFVPVHLKAGSFLLLQQPKSTIFETSRTGFTILIALNSSGKAVGDFYWDDGVTLNVKCKYTQLVFKAIATSESLNISQVVLNDGSALVHTPSVAKIKVLTAGKVFKPKINANYTIKNENYGFDLEFTNNNTLLNNLKDFSIYFE